MSEQTIECDWNEATKAVRIAKNRKRSEAIYAVKLARDAFEKALNAACRKHLKPWFDELDRKILIDQHSDQVKYLAYAIELLEGLQ
jgi:hypothetical protein